LGLGAASTAAQYVVTHPQPSHNPVNLDFLLDPLSKSEFLSLIEVDGAEVGTIWLEKEKLHDLL
jgi:hypothetical protein